MSVSMPSVNQRALKALWSGMVSATALDTRSLVRFRIGLGLVLLVDLALRAGDLGAHYTQAGILPLDQVTSLLQSGSWFAPHLHIESLTGVIGCFAAAGLAAFCILIGFQTRGMIVLSWWLLHSLQLRNPYLNHAGDKVLILMLFWSFFLPLDRNKRNQKKGASPDRSETMASIATFAITFQLASVYLLGALRKTGEMWREGTAVWYVLQIDQYARPWTRALLDHTELLKVLTWTTLGIEILAPLLLFTGLSRRRALGVGLLVLLQVGFLVTLELGLFPWISIVATLFAWPSWGSIRNAQPIRPLAGAPASPTTRLIAGLVLVLFLWQLATLFRYPSDLKRSLPGPVRSMLEILRFDQYWSMFAPNPMTIDGWYVAPVSTHGGGTVDLLRGGAPYDPGKPSHVSGTFLSDRWKEYLMTLSDLGDPAQYWEQVARYLIKRYHTHHPDPIDEETLSISYMMERTVSDGELPPVREPVWPRRSREDE